jgi:hypothetical protein
LCRQFKFRERAVTGCDIEVRVARLALTSLYSLLCAALTIGETFPPNDYVPGPGYFVWDKHFLDVVSPLGCIVIWDISRQNCDEVGCSISF